MKRSSCYKDFVGGRALWHRTLAHADGDDRAAAIIEIASGTWKRFEGTDTSAQHKDFVTCDADGWVTHHHSLEDVPTNAEGAGVQVQYRNMTLYCFSTWRLVPTKSTDNRLVWKSQYSKKSRENISSVRVPAVVIWVRVTPTPKCLVFNQHVLLNCFCCKHKKTSVRL